MSCCWPFPKCVPLEVHSWYLMPPGMTKSGPSVTKASVSESKPQYFVSLLDYNLMPGSACVPHDPPNQSFCCPAAHRCLLLPGATATLTLH